MYLSIKDLTLSENCISNLAQCLANYLQWRSLLLMIEMVFFIFTCTFFLAILGVYHFGIELANTAIVQVFTGYMRVKMCMTSGFWPKPFITQEVLTTLIVMPATVLRTTLIKIHLSAFVKIRMHTTNTYLVLFHIKQGFIF